MKRQIDDDQQALRDLRLSADSQNEISVLKEQVVKEVEGLHESTEDQKYDLERFHVPTPQFPAEGDDNKGEHLVIAMENLSSAVTEKFDDEVQELEKATNDVAAKERAVSEKSALLTHNKQTLSSTRARLDSLTGEDGSITRYQRVVSTMRRFASEAGIVTDFDEKDSQSVVAFLDAQLEDLVDMGGDSMTEVAPKVLKRLKKMVRLYYYCALRAIDSSHVANIRIRLVCRTKTETWQRFDVLVA